MSSDIGRRTTELPSFLPYLKEVLLREEPEYMLSFVPRKTVSFTTHSLLKEDYSTMNRYKALIIGLDLALNIGITHLYVFNDSQLIIR